MKITIRLDENAAETAVTIVCRQLDPELEAAVADLGLLGQTVAGKKDGETYFIPVIDIYYIETVENKTFIYTRDQVYESPLKLWRLEEKFEDGPFVRAGKSILMNIKKVRSMKREPNSRLSATLQNGEKLIVSRQYMPTIKKKLGV